MCAADLRVKNRKRKSYADAFVESCRFGISSIGDIVPAEARARGFAEPVVRQYLTRHIVFELSDRDYAGMNLYLERALRLERQAIHV